MVSEVSTWDRSVDLLYEWSLKVVSPSVLVKDWSVDGLLG